jgi:hypothetical protein
MRWGRSLVVLFCVVVLGASATVCSGIAGASGSGSRGDAPEWSCSREELLFAAGAYLNALTGGDPATLPFSADLKATENGAVTEPGQGLWQTAGVARFQRSALDTETCGTHTQALLEEDGVDAIVGVRLKLSPDAPEITEVETYVTRDGDYFLFAPEGLMASDGERPEVAWEEPVPAEQRSTREELIQIAGTYFDMFGGNVDRTPFQTDCDRWENGQRMTTGDCTAGVPTGDGTSNFITHRRYQLVDVEAGIVIAYVLFADALDFHMFKVVDGGARLISAVVTDSGHESTGWEEQEAPA